MSRITSRLALAASALTITALALTACGASNDAPAGDSTAGPSGLIEVKVGASPTPHAEILEFVQDNLAEEAGITITVTEFTDYILPNEALASGEIAAVHTDSLRPRYGN